MPEKKYIQQPNCLLENLHYTKFMRKKNNFTMLLQYFIHNINQNYGKLYNTLKGY